MKYPIPFMYIVIFRFSLSSWVRFGNLYLLGGVCSLHLSWNYWYIFVPIYFLFNIGKISIESMHLFLILGICDLSPFQYQCDWMFITFINLFKGNLVSFLFPIIYITDFSSFFSPLLLLFLPSTYFGLNMFSFLAS